MKRKIILLVTVLFVLSCTESKQSIEKEVSIETSAVRVCLADENITDEVKEESDLFNNNDVMKANLTTEEVEIIKSIKGSYYDCMKKVVNQEPVEIDLDMFTQNMTDFEKYMTVLLESFNRELKRQGYKSPEESVFQKKLNEIWKLDEREDLVYEFKNFKSFYIEPKQNRDPYYFEKALHVSTKYRFVLPFCSFLQFEKRIELQNKDTILPGATIGDLNSNLIIDKRKIEPEIYKNMFLFNDNKAAKVWLIVHDLDFFNRICYYEDREVNEVKLKTYLRSVPDEYDNFKINDDLLDIMEIWRGDDMMNLVYEKTDSAIVAYEADKRNKLDVKAFDLLSMFLLQNMNDDDAFTRKSFVKIACKFASMEISLNKKHANEEKNGFFNIESSSVSYRLLSENILELAKKEKYFNIPNFEEVLKVIEWDKEHDPQGSNDYNPFDYTTLME